MSTQNSIQAILENVQIWTEEEAKANLDQVCQTFLFLDRDGQEEETKVDVLQALFTVFLQHVAVAEVEEKIFQKGLTCLGKLFQRTTEEINFCLSSTEVDQETRESVEGLVQILLVLLNCLELGCKHVESLTELSATSVASLLKVVLAVILEVFTHSKESLEMYTCAGFQEKLAELCRKSTELQKRFFAILEQLHFDNGFEEDLVLLVHACEMLSKIGAVLFYLDMKTAGLVWKMFVSIVKKKTEQLKRRFDVGPTLKFFATFIAERLENCLGSPEDTGTSAENRNIGISIRACNICLKIVIVLCQNFEGFLGPDDCTQLASVLFALYRFGSPNPCKLNLHVNYSAEMQMLTVSAECLLRSSMGNKHFTEAVFSSMENLKSEWSFPLCQVLLAVCRNLPAFPAEERNVWLEQSSQRNFFSSLFTAVEKCHIELSIDLKVPGVMTKGKPQPMISVYEKIVTDVCGYVATLTASEFCILEKTLVDNVLQPNMWRALLAMDIWCFVARYGSSDLCLQHVHLLAKWIQEHQKIKKAAFVNAAALIGRLFSFLGDHHKSEFVSLYPPDQNLFLWSVVGLKGLCAEDKKKVGQCIESAILKNVRGTFTTQILFLRYAKVVLESCEKDRAPGHLLEEIGTMWCKLSVDGLLQMKRSSHEQKSNLLVLLLVQSTSAAMLHFKNSLALQVLRKILRGLKVMDNTCKIAVTFLLKNISKKYFQAGAEQQQILLHLTYLFRNLLSDSDLLVQNSALEAFAVYSHFTEHTDVVSQSVADDETLKKRVFDFLGKIPCSSTTSGMDLETFAKTMLVLANEVGAEILDNFSSLEESDFTETVEMDSQPAKKLKLDDNTEKVRETLNKLKENTEEIEALLPDFPLWAKEELKEKVVKLSSFV